MLKTRIITGLSLAFAALAAILLLKPLALSLVFAGVVLAAAWEWANLSGLLSVAARSAYVLVLAAVMAGLAYSTGLVEGSPDLAVAKQVLGFAGSWWAIALLWVMGYPGSAVIWGSVPARLVMGLLVLVPAFYALCLLRYFESGEYLILLGILLVVAADVGAFFAGRAFGKAKLAPAVSPGKSWAGFWGGLIASLLLALAVWALWPGGMGISIYGLLATALFTALASVLGDLLESMVKRHRGIKDSGTLLPGHGGVMDRLDSITAATPVFALGLLLAGLH